MNEKGTSSAQSCLSRVLALLLILVVYLMGH